MAYAAPIRIWYGPESYQNALFLAPSAHNPGVTDDMPCIVYRPGGGWAGADIADLDSRFWWTYGLNDATDLRNDFETFCVFVVQTASVGYNRTQQVGLTAWADATAYALGDYRGHGGDLWTCIDAHTSSLANDEPGVGTNWDDYWREVLPNETGVRKVADLGELTPGGLDEQVLNVQQCIAHIRRNAALYGIEPNQICVAGASAGGQMAGCAAYGEDLAWARANQIHGANRYVPYTSTQPNAALLSITPVDLTRHTTYDLKNGLYGEDASNADWVAREAEIKQAMSPLFVLHRTGLAIPTCLDFLGSTHTAGVAFTGLTGSPYHHADNGWLLLQKLTAPTPTGLGQSGHIFFDSEADDGNPATPIPARSYTTFNGAATSQGDSDDITVAAHSMLNFIRAAMGVPTT